MQIHFYIDFACPFLNTSPLLISFDGKAMNSCFHQNSFAMVIFPPIHMKNTLKLYWLCVCTHNWFWAVHNLYKMDT